MVIQWLTFAVMILIQGLAAVWVIAKIQTTMQVQGIEIEKLRTWRHNVGPQEMVVQGHGSELQDHEGRLRKLESAGNRMDCTLDNCPFRRDSGV
jgi:hypothetical protein